mmetsp:Transcript_39940/g.81790  ORF Transcript_39940/g.81790 Transcript_39940/m.81790 type:complete len:82 (-) Transcript_39940:272-517(-)
MTCHVVKRSVHYGVSIDEQRSASKPCPRRSSNFLHLLYVPVVQALVMVVIMVILVTARFFHIAAEIHPNMKLPNTYVCVRN